jgi:predicted amidohydrolase YtcJ
VFVHASYLRPDQIAKLRSLGAVPSFLFWSLVSGGDAAVKLWGEERGSRALAAATMVRQGVPFTLSHDAPISPQPSILTLVDAAVNRTTASGAVLGPRERISAYEALKAVTANAAFQIKEESTKGTLEPGKLADLVILDGNPLKVDPKTIQDLRVLQTIKEGTTVYTRPANAAAADAASGSGNSLPCVHHDVPGPGLSAEVRATLALLLAASEDRERR